jgi:outer membrane protein TolC
MKKTIIWILVAFCTFSTAGAQVSNAPDTAKSLSLSLEQAKQHAFDYNRSMKKAGIAVEQAQAAKWAAIANYLPQTSASMAYQNYLGTNLEILGQSIPMDASSTLTLQVSQAIFNANIIVGIQLAELSKSMSEKSLKQTELAIGQSVNTAYYSILVSEDNRNILKKNLENVKVLAKATHDKVNIGIGEQTEADQMDVTVANLENTLQTTERTIEMAYNSMRLLLGVGVNDELKLTDQLRDLTEKRNTFEILTKPFDLEKNPDMQMSDLSLEVSKKQLKSTYASMLPSLSAVYQHNEKILSSSFDMTMKNTLALSASVPLLVGGKNAASVKKAKLAIQSAELDNELAKDQLLIQEKQLRYNLKSSQTGYEIQKKNIEVSQRVFDNITKKYEQGLSSSLELTTANNNLLTAQSNYISAVMSLLNAQDALLTLLGEL